MTTKKSVKIHKTKTRVKSSHKSSIKTQDKMKNLKLDKIFHVVGIILVLIAVYSMFITFSSNRIVNEKIAVARELARPGELNVVAITFSGCDNCYDVTPIIEQIKSLDVNVTSESSIDYDSEEAKALMAKYNINKIPSLIVTGEINKSNSFQSKFTQFGEQINDAMIVNKQIPPYYDMTEQRVVGLVSLTILEDSSCQYCTSLAPIVNTLKQADIVFKEEKTVDVSSSEGLALISKYNIVKAPSLILDSEAKYYAGFDNTWQSLGTIDNGNYVLRNINPPYMDLIDKEEKGVVHLTLIDDKSCDTCYDPVVHKNILARFGVSFATEKTVDVSDAEGKSLTQKYNIEKVPTAIMSEGASEYPNLVNVWDQVGTIEDNGNFVFRNIEAMGRIVYKNLKTGEIVNPQ